jgi:hypothetical protein
MPAASFLVQIFASATSRRKRFRPQSLARPIHLFQMNGGLGPIYAFGRQNFDGSLRQIKNIGSKSLESCKILLVGRPHARECFG